MARTIGIKADTPSMVGRVLRDAGPYVAVAAVFMILHAVVNTYLQSMLTHILLYGIFALSLNLLYGQSGMFSLGHAAYFGVGSYAVAILSTRYGVGELFTYVGIGIVAGALLALFLGLLAVRVTGVYFLLVTLAFGQLLYSLAVKWTGFTGGANGIPGIAFPRIAWAGSPVTSQAFFFVALAFFLVVWVVLKRVTDSPFGQALSGIKRDEVRMRALGYNTWLFKYLSFAVAGAVAGLAGALYAPFAGTVAPQHLGLTTSSLVMLMVIIGGRRFFLGPLIGAAIVLALQYLVSINMPQRWPLVLGAVFVVAVFVLTGDLGHLLRRLRR